MARRRRRNATRCSRLYALQRARAPRSALAERAPAPGRVPARAADEPFASLASRAPATRDQRVFLTSERPAHPWAAQLRGSLALRSGRAHRRAPCTLPGPRAHAPDRACTERAGAGRLLALVHARALLRVVWHQGKRPRLATRSAAGRPATGRAYCCSGQQPAGRHAGDLVRVRARRRGAEVLRRAPCRPSDHANRRFKGASAASSRGSSSASRRYGVPGGIVQEYGMTESARSATRTRSCRAWAGPPAAPALFAGRVRARSATQRRWRPWPMARSACYASTISRM